jgi:hypothetical protein
LTAEWVTIRITAANRKLALQIFAIPHSMSQKVALGFLVLVLVNAAIQDTAQTTQDVRLATMKPSCQTQMMMAAHALAAQMPNVAM